MEWKPIKTAPKDGTWFIGANGDTPTRPCYWDIDDFYTPMNYPEGTIKFHSNVTHWAALPSPPKPTHKDKD